MRLLEKDMHSPLCIGQVNVTNNKASKNKRFRGFLAIYTEGVIDFALSGLVEQNQPLY
jgi:hypothetical protein